MDTTSFLARRRTTTQRSTQRRIASAAVSAILVAGLLASAGVASAAPRPKPGPCVVSAGVTFSNRNTVVTGTPGQDSIDCRASRKGMTIIGRGGGDDIVGTNAADTIHSDEPGTTAGSCPAGSTERDDIEGGAGNDTIHSSVCGGSSRGGPGDDILIAGGGATTFHGDAGNDLLDLRVAADALANGGEGADRILGPATRMLARGDEGNDTIIGGAGPDTIEAGLGDDSVDAREGDDFVNGGPGLDQLGGGDGDDVLLDDSPEADFFVGGLNATTTAPMPRPPVNEFRGWGDSCIDRDGRGTSPDDPDGLPGVGAVSPIQNDSLSGCEYLIVEPRA